MTADAPPAAARSPLAVDLCGVPLRGPLVAAAGTCGYVHEFDGVMDPRWLGAITTKSITRESRDGNAPWRILDTRAGMLNAIGLANVGLDAFLADKLRPADTVIIGSIAGHSMDDYVTVAAAFDARPELPLVELNVSCPNTATGRQFGSSPDALGELLAEVRPAVGSKPLIVKLSPEGDPVAMAAAAIEGGADALTLINTMPAMAIDVESRTPRLSRGAGGLSGPAIHPVAVRIVHAVHRTVAADAGVPIIGLGGVMDWRDAAELVLAGATAVGMGTVLFVDPRAPKAINRGLERWVRRQGATSIGELVGQVDDRPRT
ncbi:MAG: dihydroorotate dehydrogenase [Phycisphaerales bacterium]